MAESAAISLATDGAKAMGELVFGRAKEEMKLMWGLKDDLEKLKIKFSGLQLFLKDVGSARHADKRGQVSDWLSNVKDAVYVADDIMDSYDYEIIRREREKKKEFVKKFRAFFSRNNHPIVFRFRMSHRVRDALAAFDDLQKKAKAMGLKQLEITAVGMAGTSANYDEGSDILSQARQHASADANEFVGREDEKKKLIEKMCCPSNEEALISTVAILGLGAAALSLASDAAKTIGQLLMDRTIEDMQLMWGLKDELEKLKTKFSNLQLFLKDMGSAKHADKRRQVNDWVLKVKDAAYFADDIIDDYDYEIIRREHEQKKRIVKQFKDFFTRNNSMVFRIRMSRRVRDAIAMFDELDKNAQNMGLKQLQITADGIAGTSANTDEGSDILSQARRHASASAAEFVGRKDEMKKLIETMCRPSNEEAHISTVAIRGIGGKLTI